MISERTFAGSFSGFWSELLPLLTPKLVHIINDASKIHLTDGDGEPLDPIPKSRKTRDPAVVSEFAFHISELSIQDGRNVSDIINSKKYVDEAQRYAYEVVKRYAGSTFRLDWPLNTEEIEEGSMIALNYERFFEMYSKDEDVTFGPVIPGAGFVSECKADIAIGNTLFEVKTVDRNMAGKDIRQLIVYLALQGITDKRKWLCAGFFNPRRAVYHRFRVDDVIGQMSGGKAAPEVFQELVDFVSNRDIQFDSDF